MGAPTGWPFGMVPNLWVGVPFDGDIGTDIILFDGVMKEGV
jgi:hypothetical protein